MSVRKEFEQAIERIVGESLASIQEMPADERRMKTEKKFGKPMLFYSAFPFIGRGSVMREHILSHDEVEAAVDEALR